MEHDGWIDVKKDDYFKDFDTPTYYMTSLYWAITTFGTVGYGDFTGVNSKEYLFNMCLYVYFLGN